MENNTNQSASHAVSELVVGLDIGTTKIAAIVVVIIASRINAPIYTTIYDNVDQKLTGKSTE